MANEDGKNQFGGFHQEKPHGAVKQLEQLTRAAPMSGAPVSALNAPRRLQRQATRPEPTPAPEAPALAAPPQELPRSVILADVWAALAAQDGASLLVREYATRARKAAGA